MESAVAFQKPKVVARTRHGITLHVHLQSRSNYEAHYSLHTVTAMPLKFDLLEPEFYI